MVAVLHGGGCVQELGGQQAGRLAEKWRACPDRADEWRDCSWWRCGVDWRGRYGTPPVRMGSRPRSSVDAKVISPRDFSVLKDRHGG